MYLVGSVRSTHLLQFQCLQRGLQLVGNAIFGNHAVESYNDMLRDFVLKQDLQKDLKSYKDAATRKEILRMSYLDIIRNKYVVTYDSIWFLLID